MCFRLAVVFFLAVLLGCQKDNGEAGGPAVGVPGLSVSGVVLEKLDADPDSFLRLKTDQGEVWDKISLTGLIIGSKVNIVQVQELRHWESPRLQRTFDRLYLGRLDFQGQAIVQESIHGGDSPQPQANVPAHGHGGALPMMDATIPKLDKAPGADGRTVEEIVNNGSSLQGRTVLVRGQVVRVTSGLTVPNVSGGTWIHIQDGSGDRTKGTHSLTIATDENLKVGDVVTMRGTVKIDDSGFLGGRVIVQGAKKSQ